MDIEYIGKATLPILSSVDLVYRDRVTNNIYTTSYRIPSKYIEVIDESQDFMLIRGADRWITVPNKNYIGELLRFKKSLRCAVINNNIIADNRGKREFTSKERELRAYMPTEQQVYIK